MLNIILASIFLAIGSYYDLTNDREVPDLFLYASLAISIIYFLFNFDIAVLFIAALTSLILYLTYRIGQLGGADVILIVDLIFLVPFHSSFPIKIPFILTVFLISSVVFSIYLIVSLFTKIDLSKINKKAFLILVFYAAIIILYYLSGLLFAWFFILFSFVSFFLFFFYAYKDQILLSFIYKKRVEDCLEEIPAKNYEQIKGKIIKKGDIERLKKSGIKEIEIYRYPPFIPFLFIGFLISLVIDKFFFYLFF